MIMMAVVFTISLLVVNLIVELIPRRNRMIVGMRIRKDVIITIKATVMIMTVTKDNKE